MERHFSKKRDGKDAALRTRTAGGSKRPRQLRLNELKKVVKKQDVVALKEKLESACRMLVKLDVGLMEKEEEDEEDGGKNTLTAANSDDEHIIGKNESSGNLEQSTGGNCSLSLNERRICFKEHSLRSALDALAVLFISFESLKSSGVGKAVNKLCKNPALTPTYTVPADVVAKAAALVGKWRVTATAAKARSTRAKSSMTDSSSNKSKSNTNVIRSTCSHNSSFFQR